MKLVGNVFLVQGDERAIDRILTLLSDAGFQTDANPDIYERVYTHFGIDDARELRERAFGRSILGAARAFILVAPGIPSEAQNALLKTLEEPPADAHFFFVVPAPEMLLPTLRSRAQILSLGAEDRGSVDALRFLRSTPRVRIDLLKPLLEKGEDDRRDSALVLTFLSSLERMVEPRVREPGMRMGIDAIYRARAYAGDRGSLLKPLLESVALLVPVVQ